MKKRFIMLKKIVRSKISERQKKLAAKFSRYDARFSKKQRTLMLMFFCFTYGIGSIYLLVASITLKYPSPEFSKKATKMEWTIPFHFSRHINPQVTEFDSAVFIRVEHFRHYLDSLKINEPSRYGEIMNSRPHLMDSILEFEKIYLTHLKK
jgi:hypothetical protein